MDFLIVDDDKTFRDATCMLIEDEGHYAQPAADGEAALATLKDDRFDAVLLDVNLGRENGLDLLDQMITVWPNLPVVMFSAQSTVKKAVHMLVKSVHRADDFMRPGQYDLIYCAGLFDYLNDLVCQQMMDIFYELLAPGGLLVATNVDSHPARNQMECFLEWNLIYRDNRGLRAVAPQKATDPQMAIKRDPSGVNVFLEVRKPEREK